MLKNWKPIALFLLTVIFVIVIQVIAGYLLLIYFDSPQDRSAFGDMFGVVNTLFAGLAFAGIIFTIYLQSNELALQREELKLTRQELQRTAEAQEESEKALKDQVEAIKLQTEAIYRPYVVVKLEQRSYNASNQPDLFLVISNNGQTAAENLALEVTAGNLGRRSNLYLLQNVIPSFPPGGQFRYYIGSFGEVEG